MLIVCSGAVRLYVPVFTSRLQLIADKAESNWRKESEELRAVIRLVRNLPQDLDIGAYRMIGTKFWDLQRTVR